mmetsp:Transcript_11446/g.31706  ORF Transcript_11446/g.31706 Transcript_11446/m.31706 type:complete len:203 (+) Transcript_11446:633-1241(+)
MYAVTQSTRYRPTNKSMASSTLLANPTVVPTALIPPLNKMRSRAGRPRSDNTRPRSTRSSVFISSALGPSTRVLKGPTPKSNVTGFPVARSKVKPPSNRHGAPSRKSAYVKMTVRIFVDPTKMKVVARLKTTPARKVSTVSCSGRIQLSPFCWMKGPTASLKKDSTTQSSSRMRNRPPAMRGPYSVKASGPTTAWVPCCRKR